MDYTSLAEQMFDLLDPNRDEYFVVLREVLAAGEDFAALWSLIDHAVDHHVPLPERLIRDIESVFAQETYAYYLAEIPDLLVELQRVPVAA